MRCQIGWQCGWEGALTGVSCHTTCDLIVAGRYASYTTCITVLDTGPYNENVHHLAAQRVKEGGTVR